MDAPFDAVDVTAAWAAVDAVSASRDARNIRSAMRKG
jgi:hypothetical protein